LKQFVATAFINGNWLELHEPVGRLMARSSRTPTVMRVSGRRQPRSGATH